MSIGHSVNFGKDAIRTWIWSRYVAQSKILDIGAGGGTYADLLGPNNYIMDAIEIYEPALPQLITKYRTTYNMNALYFPFMEDYDLVIMGDVLEHFTAEDGVKLLNKVKQHCREMVIAVPFMYEQAAEPDNPYEEHKQADLNLEVMSKRYPDLKLLLLIENREWVHSDGSPFTFQYAYYVAKGDLFKE